MSNKLIQTLVSEIENCRAKLSECDWSNAEFYADYTAQTFYYVRHSTRLLALTASRLNYESEQKIHLRFISHLKEESNHEILALNDLKNLKFEIATFPEMNSTRLLYQPQYYKVEHEKPLSIMGYILFLETLAQKVCPVLAPKIRNIHGMNTASFLFTHGEEDPKHVAEAVQMMSMLDESTIAMIENNIIQTSYAYTLLINELKTKHSMKMYKRAV